MWQLCQPLAPLPPSGIMDLKSSAADMCSRYHHHFLAKIFGRFFFYTQNILSRYILTLLLSLGVRGEEPTDERHFVSIQEWLLVYTNTLWENDSSPSLLDSSSASPSPSAHNLLFCGPPDLGRDESMHRVEFFVGSSVNRAWTANVPTWSYDDILLVRRMYNFNAPYLPYIVRARYPPTSPVFKGQYALDWFITKSWLQSFRPRLVEAHRHYQRWLAAARFFHLDCHGIDEFRPIPESNDLVQVGLDGPCPPSLEKSGTKFSIPQLAVALENDEALLRGMARYLMHQIIDHVAVVSGLELPQFGVDHALVGAFFSVVEDDFPLAELERHGIPLHGVRVLDTREVRPLDPLAMVTETCQDVVDAIACRPQNRSHGEFMEIWKMTRAGEVRRPSRWSVKYPLDPAGQDHLLSTVYSALFDAGYRDVDTEMAGALAGVLGPATITVRDTVPLPPISPPPVPPTPRSPTPVNAPVPLEQLTDFDRQFLGFDPNSDEEDDENEFLDFGTGIISGNMDANKLDKLRELIKAAKMDPRWASVLNDFDLVTSDRMASSAERGRLADIVKAASAKPKPRRSAFELYVMRRMSNLPRNEAAKPRRFKVIGGSTESARAESSSMALQSRGWSSSRQIDDLDRGRRRQRSISPPARGEGIGYRGDRGPYKYSAPDSSRRRSRSPYQQHRHRHRSRSPYQQHQHGHRSRSPYWQHQHDVGHRESGSGWRRSRSPRRRHPDERYQDNPQYGNRRRSPSVPAQSPVSPIPPPYSPVVASPPLPATPVHMSLDGEPLELPTSPSSPIHPTSLKEQPVPPTPSGRMSVDEAPSRSPTRDSPLLARMSLDEPTSQATAPVSLGQHPAPALDAPTSQVTAPVSLGQHPAPALDSVTAGPLENADFVQSNQTAMEMVPEPHPEVGPATLDPVVPVGQWFRIEFAGVTTEVNMKHLFQLLVEDRLIGIRARRLKNGANKTKAKKVQLAFKSQQRRDIVLARFRDISGYSPWHFTSMTALSPDHLEAIDSYRYLLDPEYVELAYAHQQSPDDLTMLLQNAPACRNIGELRDLHPFPPHANDPVDLKFYLRYRLLDFNRYPPLANTVKVPLSSPRILDRVEFTTSWLLARLDFEYNTVQRRLSMIVRAHTERAANRSLLTFWVPLFVTGGPYDTLIREIAILARGGAIAGDADVRVFSTPRPRFVESCGFSDNQQWYIEWDSMELDPRRRLNSGEGIFSQER
jgi:hypothetical protein